MAGNIAMVGGSISNNTAASNGGGIDLEYPSNADFANLVMDNNAAPAEASGGGVSANGSSARFTNLLLTHNSANSGGGMFLTSSDIHIVNATITQNGATVSGSAIDSDTTLSLANSIVWENYNNPANPTVDVSASGATATISHSILQEDCPPANATCTAVSTGNPLFLNEQLSDFRIQRASPGVDGGDVSALPPDTYDLDGDGNTTERISQDLDGKPRVAIGNVDLGAYEVQALNINWTKATEIQPDEIQPNVFSGSLDRYIDRQGQSQWFKFAVQPDSKVLVALTNLAANYDLTLYKDIGQAFDQLNASQDLVHLNAEFASDAFSPDTYSPDTYSPDTYSPDTYSPDTYSPDTYSPDTYSPDTYSPDTYSPDTYSPDTYSPDTYSPDTYSPDTYSPDTYSPDTYSPDTYSPDTYSPDTYSSAQTRSLITVSAHNGTQSEGIIVNTWTQSGYFYVRVRGRNGAFNSDNPFRLQVTILSGSCGSVSPVLTGSSPDLPDTGNYQTLILTNLGRTEGTPADMASLQNNLSALAAHTNGLVLDVGGSGTLVGAFADQAQDPKNTACVYAMNLQAKAIKDIVDAFRGKHPELQYIVLVGNDHAIPFFRYSDNALLASETDYSPPVLDNTTSQASLKSGYIPQPGCLWLIRGDFLQIRIVPHP